MAMLVKGLGCGLVAAGAVASFAGAMMVFCSFCYFVGLVAERLSGRGADDEPIDENCDGEE